MATIILVIHLMIAVALVAVVLLQRSEGGALGIGGGGGGGFMSGRGAGDALTRATGILAGLFFITSLALGIIASRGSSGGSLLDNVPPPPVEGSNTDAVVPAPLGSGLGEAAPAPAEAAPAAPATTTPAEPTVPRAQ